MLLTILPLDVCCVTVTVTATGFLLRSPTGRPMAHHRATVSQCPGVHRNVQTEMSVLNVGVFVCILKKYL